MSDPPHSGSALEAPEVGTTPRPEKRSHHDADYASMTLEENGYSHIIQNARGNVVQVSTEFFAQSVLRNIDDADIKKVYDHLITHDVIDKGTGRWSCFNDKNPSNFTRNDYSLKIQKWTDARVVVNQASKEVKAASARAAREVNAVRVVPRERLEKNMVVNDVPEVSVGSDSEVRSRLTNPTTTQYPMCSQITDSPAQSKPLQQSEATLPREPMLGNLIFDDFASIYTSICKASVSCGAAGQSIVDFKNRPNDPGWSGGLKGNFKPDEGAMLCNTIDPRPVHMQVLHFLPD